MKNLSIAELITQSAIRHFGVRLHAVLLYGSSLSARRKPNDLDIIVILNEREGPEDLLFLRLEKERYSIEIDLQIINLHDLNTDYFAHDTHGQFLISFLRSTKVMYGTNPFLKLFPKYTDTVRSVIQKAQYYYFRAKKYQANEVKLNDGKDLSFHRKKLLLMLADFWLAYSGKVENISSLSVLEKVIRSLKGRSPLGNEKKFLLDPLSKEDWKTIFAFYQSYYFSLIDILQVKPIIQENFVGNIYSKLYSVKSNKLVIVASGCPSDYNETEIIQFLNIQKIDAVSFHYSGTGESKGVLFRRPQDDLQDVVNFYLKKYKTVILLGNSYGGYAALSCANIQGVERVVAVSPVINFKRVKNIETLPKYLSSGRPGFYRFDEGVFSDFLKKESLPNDIKSSKVTVIHGKDDEQIDSREIIAFCKKNNAKLCMLPAGHISLNRLTREHLDVLKDSM